MKSDHPNQKFEFNQITVNVNIIIFMQIQSQQILSQENVEF
jgi:hypothetical protein